jgi:FKBP-type peptidyl-prolyl cis-trans isomerase FklB
LLDPGPFVAEHARRFCSHCSGPKNKIMTSHLVTNVAVAALFAAGVYAQDKVELKDAKQKASYAIGMDIGSNFKRQDLDVDPKALAAGIADTMTGKTQLTEAEAKLVLDEFRKQLMAKMETKQKTDADKNIKEGEAFLAANGKKEGVKTTATGLQYKVLKAGDGKGKTPKTTDTVKVHYHGTLIDGSVFDSSVERGEPATFGVGQVIPGWTEVLQLMKEGDKWQVYIPSKLAYGERGPSPKIGPNSTLIFDVELLSVEKAN